MKRLLFSVMCAAGLVGSPAGAATKFGSFTAPPPAPVYGVFGNNTIPDCEYVADANLIQHEYPRAQITTAEVVEAYQTHPVYVYWDNFIPLTFLTSTGFDGYTILSFQRIFTDTQTLTGANSGGVYAFLDVGQPLYHAVAIVGANATGPVVVWYGTATQETWAWYDARQVVQFAILWPHHNPLNLPSSPTPSSHTSPQTPSKVSQHHSTLSSLK